VAGAAGELRDVVLQRLLEVVAGRDDRQRDHLAPGELFGRARLGRHGEEPFEPSGAVQADEAVSI
jgi:hypothetical protein